MWLIAAVDVNFFSLYPSLGILFLFIHTMHSLIISCCIDRLAKFPPICGTRREREILARLGRRSGRQERTRDRKSMR